MTWNDTKTKQTNYSVSQQTGDLNEINASRCFTCGHPLTQKEINSQPVYDDRPECEACWHLCLEEREGEEWMLNMYPYPVGYDGSAYEDYGFSADWYDIHLAEEFDRNHHLGSG